MHLDDYRKGWVGGMGICGACGALWPGVAHESRLWALECPRCHAMAGAMVPNDWLDPDAVLGAPEYAARELGGDDVYSLVDGTVETPDADTPPEPG